jgi:hypothetical protein
VSDPSLAVFVELAKSMEKDKSSRDKGVEWGPGISDSEKKHLREYFDTLNPDYDLSPYSRVIKSDLDGDGSHEFLGNLVLRNPKPGRFGEVLCIVAPRGRDFQASAIVGPRMTLLISGRLHAEDVSGDGVPEIVEESVEGEGETEPANRFTVYQRGPTGYSPLLSESGYSFIEMKDLDGDKNPEILQKDVDLPGEFIVEPTVLWTKIFAYRGNELKRSDASYSAFYKNLRTEYQDALSKEEVRNEEFKKKVGRDNEVFKETIQVIRRYLLRIDSIASRAVE